MQLRTETFIQSNGTIVLKGLPFHEGDKVVVTISPQEDAGNIAAPYSLRGLSVEYRNPFDPVAENEWESLS